MYVHVCLTRPWPDLAICTSPGHIDHTLSVLCSATLTVIFLLINRVFSVYTCLFHSRLQSYVSRMVDLQLNNNIRPRLDLQSQIRSNPAPAGLEKIKSGAKYERRQKMQKLGWFGGLRVTQGHQQHSHSIEHIRLPI